MMIKLLIFDLDNTLFDTYNQIGKKVLERLIVEMKKLGLTDAQEKFLRERYSFTGFRIIAKTLNFSPELTNLGLQVYQYTDLRDIKPYADAKLLAKMSQPKVLVTSGYVQVQQRKVDLLGLRHYFEEVIVDESNSFDNKRVVFEQVMKKRNLKPSEVMVIGDNPESEISAGNKLGMVTVQIVRRPGMLLGPSTYKVKNLRELNKLLMKESVK